MPPVRQFRWACPDDFDRLGELMFDSVRNGDSPYSEAQRAAWSPAPPAGEAWAAQLGRQDAIVAEEGGEAVGFMTLAEGGYVDLAFIRPRARRSGLFRQLLERIVERAVAKGEPRLWTHASLSAEPAFAALGFTVRRRERVRIGDQALDRCEMERRLAAE
ncbi:MAG TPA: GNAT family N-acetyltransferase [Allosphingosinicella sp.]|jgi:putative acetyltransferase|nr:GNAT family N-acetyltransferase [Allosphingosinicella sp.]